MSGLSQRIKDENFYKKKFIDHLDTDNEPNQVHKEELGSEFRGSNEWAISISENNSDKISDSEAENEAEVTEEKNGEGE